MSTVNAFNLDWSKFLSSGKGLTLPPHDPDFKKTLRKKAFENSLEKGENTVNLHFLSFRYCFLPIPKQSSTFEWHLFCHLLVISIWTSLTFGWLVVFGFTTTFTPTVISWWSVTNMSFLAFSHQYSTNTTFFPKPPNIFLTCSSRGESRKNARRKVGLKQVLNSKPPSHESDTLPLSYPGRASLNLIKWYRVN